MKSWIRFVTRFFLGPMLFSNALGNYDPVFYASEALILLYKALGMSGRVYRGYEKSATEPGSTVNIRKPSSFTAQGAPGSAQDIKTDTLSILLDQWQEVRFSLTDKELAYTGQRIIRDHIQPAAYALADKVDADLAGLYKFVPWTVGTAGTTPFGTATDAAGDVKGFTLPRKQLVINKSPMSDLHFMLDPSAEANALGLAAFAQNSGAGAAGVDTQLRGTLGNKYGFEVFTNQNVRTHTKGTDNTTAGAINLLAGYTKGATTMAVDGLGAGTVVAGDIFSIAGDTQKYCVTGGPYTIAANAIGALTFWPPLAQDHADNDVITFQFDNRVANLAFHRNFAALAVAPLPDFYNGEGVRVFTATDDVSGLAVRARTWADGNNSKYVVCLDILYGYKVLDPNLACVLMG